MKTVLLAWELGGGLGHISKLYRLAKSLQQSGYRCVIAVKNLLDTSALIKDEFPLFQSPLYYRPNINSFYISSYADLLAWNGYSDADELYCMVRAWLDLFGCVHPDLVITDHAPTACLASHGSIPVVMVGTGFTVPPVETLEFPVLNENMPASVPQSHLYEVITEVLRRLNRPEPGSVTEFMQTDVRSVCTLSELDPYRSSRLEEVLGPFDTPPEMMVFPQEPALFVYCDSDYEEVDSVITALAEYPVKKYAYLRGKAGVYARFLSGRNVVVFEKPPPLREILPKVSAIMHHGGNGLAHAALYAGRPQILLPRYFEMQLTTEVLENFGVANSLRQTTEETDTAIRQCIDQIFNDDKFRNYAAVCAEALQNRPSINAFENTVESCLGLLE